MTKKKLYRSEDKIFAGVIGGIAEYFDVDATILRLAYVLIAVITGIFPAIIAYIIAILIVPQKPKVVYVEHTKPAEPETKPKSEPKYEPEPEIEAEEKDKN